ncbi:MAG TPA: DegV family protein [Firmicutes bacterium]|jgi:DegV family protein with EDD domain|nr:DegV family protein [Bacillota bacterium]
MRPVQFVTDSSSDLPVELTRELDMHIIPLTYIINGEAKQDDLWVHTQPADFYNQMRSGASCSTSQVTVNDFVQHFTSIVESGKDVLYLCFSSALSGTYNAAVLASKNVAAAHPEARIKIVDTRSASLGEGLLAYETALKVREGGSLGEVYDWAEENKLLVNHWFTVGDLEYLRRGGRISHFTSTVGSLLQVKPILRVDDEGRLVSYSKARGRKRSIDELAKHCISRIDPNRNNIIAISHGDCEADALELQAAIKKEVPVAKSIIRATGPVIGSHSGPETLALFFWGGGRD